MTQKPLICFKKNDNICDVNFRKAEEIMSRVCEICGKGKMSGHNVSHSNRKSNRTYEVNLQKTTITVDGKEKTVKACTKCIKSAKKA